MPKHITRVGITNKGFIPAPPMMDKSNSVMLKVTTDGSRLWKQTPGMNNSIVPLTPEPRDR